MNKQQIMIVKHEIKELKAKPKSIYNEVLISCLKDKLTQHKVK